MSDGTAIQWSEATWNIATGCFVNSLADLFHEGISADLIAKAFAVMAGTPQHTYQVLSKRHARMRSLLRDECRCGSGHLPGVHLRSAMSWAVSKANGDAVPGLSERQVYHDAGWPLPNVHLGVSAESQSWAQLRIPALLDTPAAVRWVSAEPLLGPLSLRRWLGTPEPGINWVVLGGESGPGACPMDLDWARSIVGQCRESGVPVFVKQLGSVWAKQAAAKHHKGGDPAEWPEDLRVREMPRQREAAKAGA